MKSLSSYFLAKERIQIEEIEKLQPMKKKPKIVSSITYDSKYKVIKSISKSTGEVIVSGKKL